MVTVIGLDLAKNLIKYFRTNIGIVRGQDKRNIVIVGNGEMRIAE